MAAEFHLRPATLDDAVTLSEIGRVTFIQNFGHLYTEKNLNDFLDGTYMPRLQADEIAYPENHIMLACVGEKVVGYAKSGPNKLPIENPPQPAYELHRIYLLPEAQGLGAGAALLKDALDYFARKQAASVYIGVWAENHNAQAFYRKYGFEPVGQYHFMVGTQADEELILQMQLWSPAK
ncbi:MAG: GNAT family N-acetyltransferase [Alphaproteobacteria bacterium]|nr:GNAT family N-acetyltransferase [Alphaproteobacteria bacterium]